MGNPSSFQTMPVIFREGIPDIRTTISFLGAHRQCVARNWAHPAHHHIYYEVNYVLEGRRTAWVDGHRYPQEVGDMLLIRPDIVHSNVVDGSDELLHFTMHFSIDDPEITILVAETSEVLFHCAPDLRAIVEKMALSIGCSEVNVNPLLSRLTFQSYGFEFLSILMAELLRIRGSANQFRDDKLRLAQDIKARVFNLTHPFNLEGDSSPRLVNLGTVCKEFGYSPSHCNQVFKDVYGTSIRQYLTSLVLDQASVLLRQLDRPITDIALALGYSDVAHFSRQFKRWTGKSPFAFRHRADERSL